MLLQVKLLITLLILAMSVSCSKEEYKIDSTETNINLLNDDWPGKAIAYSGYRVGHHPDSSIYPSQAEVLEDLKIIEKNWKIIRTYGADQHASDVLEIIKREKINIKVLLGIWLYAEPERINDNRLQITKGIELANKYKDIVIAVNVGNECQVHWSDHKVPNEKLISYIKEVKTKVNVPLTTADSWDYWADLSQSARLIEVVDFVAVHIYPIWGKVDIDKGMSATKEIYDSLKSVIPNKKIVITEAGWATYTEGELHVPKAGDELKQKRYYAELMKWSQENNVTIFWFEAFDEPWKGTGTEGYWGLFTEGRKAKRAMHKLYPKLIIDEPTSPSYK
jgi:exo-beta-1,3-glucanase (GH17 family)